MTIAYTWRNFAKRGMLKPDKETDAIIIPDEIVEVLPPVDDIGIKTQLLGRTILGSKTLGK